MVRSNWHRWPCLNAQQIAAYEREISKLREELLKEIGHLEEKKEEAVKAAANCSPEHFQNLQEQFFSELVTNPFMMFLQTRKLKIYLFGELFTVFGLSKANQRLFGLFSPGKMIDYNLHLPLNSLCCQAYRSVSRPSPQHYAAWRPTMPVWGARFETSPTFMEQQ